MITKSTFFSIAVILVLSFLAGCGNDGTNESPRTGDIAPDFTLSDTNGNMVSLVDELGENEQVVLVFYYTYICTPCMTQLREIERDRAKYEEMGAQVIAIAVQSDISAKTSVQTSGAQFPILADSDHTIAKAYGVYDLLPEDDGLSTPSVFVINQDRQIVWDHIASSIFEEGDDLSHAGESCGGERVPSQTILENLPG
jgi:peroxiredoxin